MFFNNIKNAPRRPLRFTLFGPPAADKNENFPVHEILYSDCDNKYFPGSKVKP